jgi:rubredoxin
MVDDFQETMACPKCKGKMDKGRLGPYRPAWKKGTQLFFLFAPGIFGGSVWTYKCSKCGYLESYDKTDS